MLPAEERRAFVELALVPGIGPTRLAHLHAVFGSYRGALGAPLALLRVVPAMTVAAATAIVSRDRAAIDRVEESLHRLGGGIVTPLDIEFPAGLRAIDDPPTILFTEGRLELLDRITVASGMARGLDAVAHWAAVDQPGGTIGVLGNGLGVIYPSANRTLYRRVAEEGLLITEFPPGERPNAGSFQRRNRLISGLARATIVVEGREGSGALITAHAAVDQGRDVLVVPGPITSRLSAAPHALLRNGAKPYLGPEDFWHAFPDVNRGEVAVERTVLIHRPRRVLETLDGVPRTVDDLAGELGWAPAEVAGALTELEVVGLADRGPAGFTRAR